PQISSRGFLLSRDSDSLLVEARKRVQNVLNGSVNGNLARDVEKELGNLFYSETHRRPIVYVTVARE
ncbi:MAG: ribonuclease J, partial [Bellilinea sp.]